MDKSPNCEKLFDALGLELGTRLAFSTKRARVKGKCHYLIPLHPEVSVAAAMAHEAGRCLETIYSHAHVALLTVHHKALDASRSIVKLKEEIAARYHARSAHAWKEALRLG